MQKIILSLLLTVYSAVYGLGQPIQDPSAFLGYPLGTEFTYHNRMLDYVRYVAQQSPYVQYQTYGTSYEGRELGVAFVSAPENLANLETLRQTNLAKTGLTDDAAGDSQLPFIWLSYNIHGGESNGMEAAMKVLFTLAAKDYEGVEDWLKTCVIVIDPCLNPDGRERYTSYNRMTQSKRMNLDPNSWERSQPWPGSRSNHYFFDMNRDWTWQTQTESRQRLALYQSYMPHVHADFHEMGADTDYFFPPGAEPWHDAITPWQREFHTLTGKANAALFDKEHRLYFTAENFDLFGPSYGDTWPLFNGAMGFTYEQGGGPRAGLAVTRNVGDTLTLVHRIEGHFLSSIATIQASYENRARLIDGFNAYFETARNNPPGEYKSYIIKGDNDEEALRSLLELLDNNSIRYYYAAVTGRRLTGRDYVSMRDVTYTIEEGDMLVPAYQPQGHFVKVLFEPQSNVGDSLTYDLTGWSLPYAYNLKSFAVRERLAISDKKVSFATPQNTLTDARPYAYLVDWKGFREVQFLAALFRSGIRVRSANKPFTIDGFAYGRGTLIIARGDNRHNPAQFDGLVREAARHTGVRLQTASTGMAEKGVDFGSGYVDVLMAPRIATFAGTEMWGNVVGEMRYFFDQELDYPLTVIDTRRLSSIDLSDYDVLILPPGNYEGQKDQLMTFVRQGGKVLAIQNAAKLFGSDDKTALGKAIEMRNNEQKASDEKRTSNDPNLLKPYEDGYRHMLSERSAGAIYKVHLDNTHPYTFGMGDQWFVMKSDEGLPFLASGHNIGYILEAEPMSGFSGYKFREEVKNTLVIGAERIGRGEVVYISDNPYFRAFWKSGRLLLGNVLLK